MRITFGLTYGQMNYAINSKKEDINHLSNTVSSGNQLQKPSDSPYGWGQAFGLKQGLNEMAGYENNIDFATGWGQATETALDGLTDLVNKARDVGMSAIKGTSQEQKDADAAEIDGILQDALNVANTKYGDRYIFSVNAQSAPFSLSSTPDPLHPTNPVPRVMLDGIDIEHAPPDPPPYADLTTLSETVDVRVGTGRTQTVNRDGAQVFYNDPTNASTNLFVLLRNLRDAIKGGDTTTVQNSLTELEKTQSTLSEQTSLVGADLTTLDRQKNILESTKTDRQGNLADVQEGDMIETITNLQQKQITFQAALQVTGTLDKLNLLQYV